MAGAFDAKVDISTAEAVAGLRAIRSEVKGLGPELVALDKIIKDNKQNLVLVAQQFTKLVAAQTQAAAAAKDMAQADIAAARAAGIRNVADAKVAESVARKGNQDAQATKNIEQANLAAERGFSISQKRVADNNRVSESTARAAASQDKYKDSLSNSRYLMYDVGATYGVLATALLAIPAATAAVAAGYQKDFAQVIRVNEDLQQSSQAATAMKDALKGLDTELPVTFEELSRITQLGAQMGVTTDKLAAFTETTAKFVAVTGISADTGATLFGRMETSFNNLGQVPDFFNKLGSSIAYVGAKTVATDPEIAAMLNQIGPLGASAGFSAEQVTGLSAALASVRVQPELARGTLTRVFAQLNRDTAEGGPKLAAYGKLLGISGDEAKKLWESNPSQFFTRLIQGLNKVHMAGGNLTGTFDSIGIKATRDVSALTKLAVGYDVLTDSMQAADKGFKDGDALDKMSKVTFETITAQLVELANAWKNLGDTLGSGPLKPLAILIETLKNAAIGIDSLVKHVPLIGTLIQVLMGIATVTALFLGFKAAQAFVMAGMIGFQQAAARGMGGGLAMGNQMRTLAQTMLIAKGATDQQTRALIGQAGAFRALVIASNTSSANLKSGAAGSFGVLATSTGKATGGIKGAGAALIGMAGGPIGIAIGALTLLAGSFINTAVEAEQAGKAIADAMAQGAEQGMKAAAEQLTSKDKVSLTDGLGLGEIGKNVRQIAEEIGVNFDKVTEAATQGKDAVKALGPEFDRAAQAKGFKDFNALLAGRSLDAGKFNFIKDRVKAFGDASVTAAEDTKAIEKAAPKAGAAIKGMGDDGGDAATEIDKLKKAIKDLNDEIFGSLDAQTALQESLGKLGDSVFASKSFDAGNDAGRANIKALEDSLSKAQERYAQLKATNQMTAQQAAQGYAEFVTGLISQIKADGGKLGDMEALALSTKDRFAAAVREGDPVSVPVTTDPSQVQAAGTQAVQTVQAQINASPAQVLVTAHTQEALTKLQDVATNVSKITGIPYTVVMDALTDPASTKAGEVRTLLKSIEDHTYKAPVDANTDAFVTNIRNAVTWAGKALGEVMNAAGRISTQAIPFEGQVMKGTAPQRYVPPTIAAAPDHVNPTAGSGGSLAGYTNERAKQQAAADKKAAEEASKAAKKAQKDFKDLADGITEATKAAEDFGNRVKTGLTSAFNQQYGLTKATDDYHSALNAINKKREDEIKQVQDLKDKIRALNDERDKELISANKAKIEQGISLKYGEVARAADYGNQASTALGNASDKSKEIAAAKTEQQTIQDGIGKLDGYSDAAIANREALRGLESKMIDMIAAYASQGHSVDEVRRYAEGLTAQYQRDVGQMGLNMAAVQNLTGDLGRYIDTINRVPRLVPTKVEADTDAATQAIGDINQAIDDIPKMVVLNIDSNTAAFEQHVADAIARAENNLKKTLSDPAGTGSSVGGRANGQLFGGAWKGGMAGEIRGFSGGGSIPGTPSSNPRHDNLFAQVSNKGFIKVRSREFIQPENAVNYYGLDFMESVRTLKLPKFAMSSAVASGGSSGSGMPSVVGLDAHTLSFLASLKQEVKLYTENRLIAASANAGNKEFAAEGRN